MATGGIACSTAIHAGPVQVAAELAPLLIGITNGAAHPGTGLPAPPGVGPLGLCYCVSWKKEIKEATKKRKRQRHVSSRESYFLTKRSRAVLVTSIDKQLEKTSMNWKIKVILAVRHSFIVANERNQIAR